MSYVDVFYKCTGESELKGKRVERKFNAFTECAKVYYSIEH